MMSTTLIALALGASALYLFSCAVLVAFGTVPFTWGLPLLGDFALMGPVIFAFAALLNAAAAIGLLKAQPWGRWLTIVILAVGIWAAIPTVSGSASYARMSVAGAGIVLRVAALWLLFQARRN